MYLLSICARTFSVIVLLYVGFVITDELSQPTLKEISHGVLIKNIGFLLQGGGQSHAMLKINLTNLELNLKLSCSGLDMIQEFAEKKRNIKQSRVINEITPLIKTLQNLCAYTQGQMSNLIKTFRLHNDREKRSIGGILISSLVGTMASSVFTTIYEAITGNAETKLIGVVENHEDRLSRIEHEFNFVNETLTSLTGLIEETRSTLHLTTSLEILVNNQFFHLNMFRKIANGFYQILAGHLSPDLIEFEKIEELYISLKNKAEKQGLTLVADHPSELYQYDTQFISYTNQSTNDVILVIYITPPVFRPGASFTLKKILLLPISWKGVSSAVTLNAGKDVYIAQNPQTSMSQVLSSIEDCKKYRNFYSCGPDQNTGVHFKDNDRCVLAILEGG